MPARTPIQRARTALRAIYRLQQLSKGRQTADPELGTVTSGSLQEPLVPIGESEDGEEGITLLRAASRQSQRSARDALDTDGDVPVVTPVVSQLGNGPLLVRRVSRPLGDGEVHTPGAIAPHSDLQEIWGLLTSSWLNVLLMAVPLGFAAHLLNWPASVVFGTNFLALVPLALILGEVTEDLAVRFGDVVGGLLNATFGNVVELILSLAALSQGLYDVVATSLLGSVLSNLLLVLGCCFLLGGTQYKQQRFNTMVNKAMCSLLFLSCIALAIPTAAKYIYDPDTMPEEALLKISRGTAVMLIFVYCAYLLFQLKTHADTFPLEGSTEENGNDTQHDHNTENSDTDGPALSLAGALSILTAITVVVAFCSEFLTGSIEEVSKNSGINRAFLGLIVLPIAGNACEHITAVFVAMKNKMDLAIGVALGSSIQIAIFCIPFIVVTAWGMGRDFSLSSFDPFAVLILTLSVIHSYFVSSDGYSNWLVGLQLLSTYVLIAILFFFKQG